MDASIRDRIVSATSDLTDRLCAVAARLAAVPSVNAPPTGLEGDAQRMVVDLLWQAGFEASEAEIDDATGDIERHPAYNPEHDLSGRPNVSGILRGSGSGRSLAVIGHVDTLPVDAEEYPDDGPYHDAFVADELVAPGMVDGKGALAAALCMTDILSAAGLRPEGDVFLASVVDETSCGLQGMLALTTRGVPADAALLLGSVECVLSVAGAWPTSKRARDAGVEPWICGSSEFADTCRRAAAEADMLDGEDLCPPSCGAFLLNNYAESPTVVVGAPTEDEGKALAAPLTIDALERYAALLALLTAEWCGVSDA